MMSGRSSQLRGVSMKHLSLVFLSVQNSALILIMHYSMHSPAIRGHRYYPSTAIFLNEIIKLAVSLTLALYDLSSSMPSSLPVTSLFKELVRKVFTEDSWKLAIPACLYTLQQSLQYLATANFQSAATLSATFQFKVVTTAVFGLLILGKSLNLRKCASLLVLTIGVAIVQISSEPDLPTLQDLKDEYTSLHLAKRSATYEGIDQDLAMQNPQLDKSIGMTAVFAACALSGLAGTYFEKVLRDSNGTASVWVRNVQLSFYSLFPALFVGVVFVDGADIARNGFFIGYNWIVWTTIALQALGGVALALVSDYASADLKGTSTSVGIIVSFLVGISFLDFETTTSYIIGTVIVLVATYLYSSEASRPRPPPIVIADYEKTTVGDEPSYFDIPSASLKGKKTPLRGDAISTSRPGTPTYERRQVSGSSSKREV